MALAQLTWVNVVQILLLFFGGGTMVVTGIKVVWNLISQSGRISDVHEERDRAIVDRDYFRDLLEKERGAHDKLKVHWKGSVIAYREARRVEESSAGAPSVPPLSVDEPTGRFFIDEASDQEYRRQSEEHRARLALEREKLTREYNQDMTSTPPNPHPPIPPRRLPKFRP
jgi:hypothetical protein